MRRGARLSFPIAVATAIAMLAFAAFASAAEPITDAGGPLRSAWYPEEASLNPELLKEGGFGRIFDTPVQGQVYAQPLLSNGTVLAATEDNRVYGLDAQSGAVQWEDNVGTPWNSADIGCPLPSPHVGITATPVIDPNTDTAYFTSKTYAEGEEGPALWYMHAVNMANGEERPGFPVEISGQAQNIPGVKFDPTRLLQRPALLLMNGVVYAAFGSLCDFPPYQGWIAGVSTAGQVRSMWATSPAGASIWQAGGGLLSDGEGQILFATGNSECEFNCQIGGFPPPPGPGSEPPEDLGESVGRVSVQFGGTVVTATDFFSPSNNVFLDAKDFDLGSGAPLGLPSPYFGTGAIPHLLVEVGKEGVVYLIDRDHLGGMGQGPEGSDDVVQEIKGTGGLWGSMAAWPGDGGYVYVPATGPGATGTGGDEGPLEVFQYGLDPEGRPHLSLIATSQEPLHYHSGSPVVTSDGASNGSGVVWIPRCPAPGCEGSTLDAYAAVPQAGHPPLLWRGSIGVSTRFSRPGVGDGRIYVGTYDGHVLGFGSTATQHTLAVAKSGGGAGAVSSNFGGIDCGASCSHAFAEGTHLTLTATPTAHSEFAGFSGGGCSGTGTCEVTIEADTAVTANFTVTQHTLTVARSGSGAGTVSSEPAGINCGPTCSHQFSEGGTVTLSATPSHSTVSWSGCTTATANTCHVEDLQANGNITATFAQDRPALGEEAASSLGRDAATLSGAVNPNGAATTCRFEYGASESYGTTLPCSFNPGSGASPVAVTAPALSGLAAATAFHYRLDATNSGGTTKGTDHTFTTLPDTCATNAALCPSALIPPAISQPAPVAKPLRCRKGFRKRRVHGKARCTKRTKIVAKEARNQNLGQTILTTTKGLTLYSLSVERNGKFTCTRSSGCLSVWHPLTVPTKTVPTGPVKLGTVKRPDGGVQVTYHGHPLYSFGGDAEPGQANGEGIVDVGIWTAAVAPTPKR